MSQTMKGKVWCDASSLAMGIAVEIEGVLVEDAAWLRKKGDFNHINVSELEAALKGVNLAIKWGMSEFVLVTDSATVFRWIQMTLTEEKKIKTKGAAEIVIKRRLGVLKNLVDEFNLKIDVKLVPSHSNKADVLTRVRKKWIIVEEYGGNHCAMALEPRLSLQECHNTHHMRVDRTFYLAKKIFP